MNGVTEIYICTAGQTVKEGRREYSAAVRTRADANIDAVRRCKADPSIALITYFTDGADGKPKTLFAYKNPRANGAGKRRPGGAVPARRKAAPRGPRAPRPTLLERILSAFDSK